MFCGEDVCISLLSPDGQKESRKEETARGGRARARASQWGE
jgi:hypothetical protein